MSKWTGVGVFAVAAALLAAEGDGFEKVDASSPSQMEAGWSQCIPVYDQCVPAEVLQRAPAPFPWYG